MAIKWSEFDVLVLSTSGGKDSQTMLRQVHQQIIDQHWYGRLVVVHADLGRVEWQGVPELAAEQAAAYGWELEIVSRPEGDLLQHVLKHGKFPGQATRFCTSDHKTAQIAKLITREVDGWHQEHAKPGRKIADRRCRVANVLGLRSQESAKRAARDQVQLNTRLSNKTKREVFDVLPIQDWTEDQVWADIRESGVRHHEAYDLGMPRLSCCFCIFAKRDVLLLAGHHNTDLLREYAAVEAETGHQFLGKPGGRSSIRLADILADVEAGVQPDTSRLASGFGDMG